MRAVKITRRLDSETLHLPELRPLLGKQVEIIILETDLDSGAGDATSARDELRGSVVRYDDPFTAGEEDDWEALR